MFLQLWHKHIHTHLLHAINTRVWQTDRRTHRQTHDDGIYRASIASRGKKKSTQPFVCNGVVVASQSFFEVCLQLPFSSRPNWSAVVDCGLISNLPWSIWLFFVLCRRFGYIPHILLPFGIVAVLVSLFWHSPFWFVAVLTRQRASIVFRKYTIVTNKQTYKLTTEPYLCE